MTGDLAQCEAVNGSNRCTGSKGHLGPHGMFVSFGGGGMVIAPWPNAGVLQDEYISKRLRCDIDGGLVQVKKMERGGDISCISCDQVHTFTQDSHSQIIIGKLFPSIENWHAADEELRRDMLTYYEAQDRFIIDARLELGLINTEEATELSNELSEKIAQFHEDQARYDSRPWYKKLPGVK